MKTLNESIAVIMAVPKNETLLDVKLFAPSNATAEVMANEFAQTVEAHRAGRLTEETESLERVTGTNLYDDFPELASF